MALSWFLLGASGSVWAQANRYATSDNMSGYVHWIDLYDEANRRIDPAAEDAAPYSPAKTCGRCHEVDTISHGWHFNALTASVESESGDSRHGRPGQPWIWSDDRTGTHLPLSYREWPGSFNPDQLGLSRWQVAEKLGGYFPGGGVGSEESMAHAVEGATENRSDVTGALPIDCMLCHRNGGSGYSPFAWTEQIENQNFRYGPTVALGLATVSGNMSRLSDDFDATAEGAADKLPKLQYEQQRFRSDGKVFFDLIRKPQSDACYYCHTNQDASAIQGERWMHDEDVHLRAGFSCADCHRNGLGHQTVRGFDGEAHPSGRDMASLSCQGCHIGDAHDAHDAVAVASNQAAGRLGAPLPAHKGLPPIHFEKMTCTTCHSGPYTGEMVTQQVNSIAHRLGEHVKRTGQEAPAFFGPIFTKEPVSLNGSHASSASSDDGGDAKGALVYQPRRAMWSSFWGLLEDGQATPLNPEVVYDLVRRPLRTRRDFTTEIGEVKLSLSRRKELLGDDRARVKEEERTEEEQQTILQAEAEERSKQVEERMVAALQAIQEEYPEKTAVYVSAGQGFIIDEQDKLQTVEADAIGAAAEPYTWPLAHNVRPARHSLGVQGCTECHSDDSSFFQASLQPVGLLPDQQVEPIKLNEFHDTDMVRLSTWNQMFSRRSDFKIAGLAALGVTVLVVLFSIVLNLSGWMRR